MKKKQINSDSKLALEGANSATSEQLGAVHWQLPQGDSHVEIIKHSISPELNPNLISSKKSAQLAEMNTQEISTFQIAESEIETQEKHATLAAETQRIKQQEAIRKPEIHTLDELPAAEKKSSQQNALLNPSTIIDAQLRQYDHMPRIRRRQKGIDLGTLLIYVLGFFLLLGLTFAFWPRPDSFAPIKPQIDDDAELSSNRHVLKITSTAIATIEPELTELAASETVPAIKNDVHGNIYYGQAIGPKLHKNTAKDLRLPRLRPLPTRAERYSQTYVEWGIKHSKQNAKGERLPLIEDTYSNYVSTYNILYDLNKETLQNTANRYRNFLAKQKAEAEKAQAQKAQSAVTEPTTSKQELAPTQITAKEDLSAAQKASAKYRPDKVIYITYDFPQSELVNARKVLDVLDLYQTSASFFISGDFLTEAPNLVLRMNAANHAIGSLGWEAIDAARLAIRNEKTFLSHLTKLDKNFELLTGRPLDSFYRPCEGSFSEQALYLIRNAGYYPTFWGLEMHNFWPDSKDTLNFRYDNLRKRDFNVNPYPYTVEQALNLIMQELHDGLILRLDGRSKVDVDLLEPLIKKLHAKGYTCLNLNEIPLDAMAK